MRQEKGLVGAAKGQRVEVHRSQRAIGQNLYAFGARDGCLERRGRREQDLSELLRRGRRDILRKLELGDHSSALRGRKGYPLFFGQGVIGQDDLITLRRSERSLVVTAKSVQIAQSEIELGLGALYVLGLVL